MNQKVTLRFADHVLTFVVPKTEVARIKQDFRRKWIHEFTRADGVYLTNFDQVLWMKISPGDDVETEIYSWEVQAEEARSLSGVDLFGPPPASSGTPSLPRSFGRSRWLRGNDRQGGEHGSL